jgi:hypothetical protein
LFLLDSPVNPSTSLRAVSASNGPGNDEFRFPVFFCGSYFYKAFLGHNTRSQVTGVTVDKG